MFVPGYYALRISSDVHWYIILVNENLIGFIVGSPQETSDSMWQFVMESVTVSGDIITGRTQVILGDWDTDSELDDEMMEHAAECMGVLGVYFGLAFRSGGYRSYNPSVSEITLVP